MIFAMGETRCRHELLPGQCGLCLEVPAGLSAQVVVTDGGVVFHRYHRCTALLEGQRKVRSRGGQVSDPQAVPLQRVLHDRPPCVHCFPDYAPPGTRLCWVRHAGSWRRGLLKRWLGRNDAGLWEAEVEYSVDRTPVEETLDERRLFPREPGTDAPAISTR